VKTPDPVVGQSIDQFPFASKTTAEKSHGHPVNNTGARSASFAWLDKRTAHPLAGSGSGFRQLGQKLFDRLPTKFQHGFEVKGLCMGDFMLQSKKTFFNFFLKMGFLGAGEIQMYHSFVCFKCFESKMRVFGWHGEDAPGNCVHQMLRIQAGAFLGSYPVQQNQDNQNDQHQTQSTTGDIPPLTAVRPGWECAEQHQNKQDNQDRS
jgi:hypothetical protein